MSRSRVELRAPITEQGELIQLVVPEDENLLVHVCRADGEVVFELLIHVNSKWPSVDVIRKAEGSLVARSMWEGVWTLDHAVRGNHSTTTILIQE